MATGGSSADWSAIRRELLAMAEEDGRVRAALTADGTLFEGYHPRMRAVHDGHAARLTRILDEHGWPDRSKAGPDGAEAAWLIVQHAIAHPALQRRALGELMKAADRGEVPRWHPVMLEDRIRMFEGRPQRYGTQFDWDADGRLSPVSIEDRADVDQRRKSVGLRPLDEEIEAQRRAAAQANERPPADWEKRQREMQAWLRAVGWRT
jgi:hypothetical protein